MKKITALFAVAVVAMVSCSTFAADWVYDPSTSRMSDGVWTFNVSLTKNTKNLAVKNIIDGTAPEEISPLDFSKKVVKKDDESVEYTITSIGAMFYYYSGSAKYHDGSDKVGELTLPGEGLLILDQDGLRGPNGSTAYGDIVIPTSVTKIGREWFENSKITSVTFGASTMELNNACFQNCMELTSVVFPAAGNFSFTEGYVFKGCTKLEEIDLSGVVSIDVNATRRYDTSRAHFGNCTALKTVVVGTKLDHFPTNIVLSGNSSLKTIRFLGAPPEIDFPFLKEQSAKQEITTIVPAERTAQWQAYAANGTINAEDSTWAAEYVASGVTLANRKLVSYVDPTTRAPNIEAVEVGGTSANSIEIIVSGDDLNGGTITITLDNGIDEPLVRQMDAFGACTFDGLPSAADYTVTVVAENVNGSVSSEPFTTGTYGTTTLAARMYYVNTTRVATFVYDDVDRSRSAGVQQFDLGADGSGRGWKQSNNALIDGFNPVSAVFDASFKAFKSVNLSYLFNNWKAMTTIDGIENLDTSECTTMANMFYHVDSMTMVDLSWFRTGKVANMNGMFQWSAKLKTIFANENFSTRLVADTTDMFNGASALVGGNETAYDISHTLVGYAVVDTDQTPGYFTYKAPPAAKPQIAAVIVDVVGLSNATVTVTGSDLQGGTVKVQLLADSVEKMFAQHNEFGDFVFEGLDDGTTYQIVVTAENGSGVTVDDSFEFSTWSITELGARAVYLASTRTMTFYYDTIDRSNSATWAVDFGADGERTWGQKNGSDWVQDNSIATIVIDSSFAGYRPKTCSQWFSRFNNNNAGVKIDGIQYLNTSEATSMYRMFYNFRNVEIIDISGFRTRNVTTMEQMFGYGGWSEMDLSSFDTRNVTKMSEMFIGSGVTKIFANEWFVTTAVKSSGNMFNNCKKLVGVNGTAAYGADNPVDCSYARVDDPDNGRPGYFTYKAPPADKTGLVIFFR